MSSKSPFNAHTLKCVSLALFKWEVQFNRTHRKENMTIILNVTKNSVYVQSNVHTWRSECQTFIRKKKNHTTPGLLIIYDKSATRIFSRFPKMFRVCCWIIFFSRLNFSAEVESAGVLNLSTCSQISSSPFCLQKLLFEPIRFLIFKAVNADVFISFFPNKTSIWMYFTLF